MFQLALESDGPAENCREQESRQRAGNKPTGHFSVEQVENVVQIHWRDEGVERNSGWPDFIIGTTCRRRRLALTGLITARVGAGRLRPSTEQPGTRLTCRVDFDELWQVVVCCGFPHRVSLETDYEICVLRRVCEGALPQALRIGGPLPYAMI